MKRDPAAVRDDLDDVARQQRAAPSAPPASAARCRPRSARRSGSASARRRASCVSPAQNSKRRVRAHHPLRGRRRAGDRAVEAVRPLDHRRVVVRVRDRDRVRARRARSISALGLVVEQRHAVPQHVAVAVRHQQRPLADRELRLGADAGRARPRRGSRSCGRARSSSSVVHCWPLSGTYWRSSSQIGQAPAARRSTGRRRSRRCSARPRAER